MEKVINFLKYRYIAFSFSFALLVIFLVFTYMNHGGFNWGIDFVGGVKIAVKFEKGIDIAKIREVLNGSKISADVQQIGKEDENEYIIGTKLMGEKQSTQESYELVKSVLDKGFKNIQVLSVESVGPAIGDYLMKTAVYSLIIALALICVYLAFRFEFKYSVGAMVSLMHDVILSFAFAGMMGVEINIPVIAALLTILGYSVNDTIVIFDRVRENVNPQSKMLFQDLLNKSITQTLSRTILTSLTVLFSVLAILLIAGETLYSFSVVMLFGLFAGSYSTIYLASPVVLTWENITAKR